MSKRRYGQKHCSVDGCAESHLAQGFCQKHYWRNHRHGSPLARPDNDGEPLAWLKLHAGWNGAECLLWPFGHTTDGYGSVSFNGKTTGAHRAMCVLAHGSPPAGQMQAAHSCGRGHEGCVNPKHLRWATSFDNHQDRRRTRELTGRMGSLKLTDAQCRALLERKGLVSQNALAKEYGVAPSTISRLFNGPRMALAKSVERS